jgi:hypothetical protein
MSDDPRLSKIRKALEVRRDAFHAVPEIALVS